ncbi:MAG: dihydroorotate dehydrogenase electron transfer subunit [Ignavibacteriaceae bacterium]|nr:dihydroorotate dehydrogenase electron transfer subunit [Ignavibacteriaceae bacterium]
MRIEKTQIVSVSEVQSGIFILTVESEYFAAATLPGQFFNIRVSESLFPLLRRPFSISDLTGKNLSFMFDVHGEGTKILSQKRAGEWLDIIGPLGHGFGIEGEYESAIIVAGGLGVAPFPYLTKKIRNKKKIYSFIGARSSRHLVTQGIVNVYSATDDGTTGYYGNVVDLLKLKISEIPGIKKIFSCGPTPMLKSLTDWVNFVGIESEVSLECAMACGFGICQGCPAELHDGSGYKLVCKDGPVFNSQEIIIS